MYYLMLTLERGVKEMIMDYYKQAENVIDCIREKSKEEKLKLRIVNDWEIEQ